MLELQHATLIRNLDIGLCGVALAPAIVESTAQRVVVVKKALEEDVVGGIKSAESVSRHQRRAERKAMRDLECRIHGKTLRKVCSETGEKVVGEENISADFSIQILHGSWVLQPHRFTSSSNGTVDIADI